VLYPVTLEVRDAAIVALDGHIDDQDTLGPFQRFHPARQIAEMGRYTVDLFEINGPWSDAMRRQVGWNFVLAGHFGLLG
jgi:hypothetical protein